MKRFLFLLLTACVLASCAPRQMRMVDALDSAEFIAMSRAMRPAMTARNLVDSEGSWYSPLISWPVGNAGHALLDRLSIAFCASELKMPSDSTFREEISPLDRVEISSSKAVIRTAGHRIELRLVAVTDWNGDRKEDWLVVCRTNRTSSPQLIREYFLLVSDRNSSMYHPHVLMVRDRLFNRSTVRIDNSAVEFVDNVVVETEQGQIDVTQAPIAGSSSEVYGVRSSALSN